MVVFSVIRLIIECIVFIAIGYYIGFKRKKKVLSNDVEDAQSSFHGDTKIAIKSVLDDECCEMAMTDTQSTAYKFGNFLISPLGNTLLIISLYIPIMGLILAFLTVFDAPVIAVIMAVLFSYFGWQALSKITPDIFLIMPVGGWIAYYVVKGFISFFLGVFVAPWVISKMISRFIKQRISSSLFSIRSNTERKNVYKAVNTTNVSSDYVSDFEKTMLALTEMSDAELESMHKDLLFYTRNEPVPTEGRDYLEDLLKYRRTQISSGTVYGCTTYGEIEKLNAAVVDVLNKR